MHIRFLGLYKKYCEGKEETPSVEGLKKFYRKHKNDF